MRENGTESWDDEHKGNRSKEAQADLKVSARFGLDEDTNTLNVLQKGLPVTLPTS